MTVPAYDYHHQDPRLTVEWNTYKMLKYLKRKFGPERGYMIYIKQESETKHRSLTFLVDLLERVNPKDWKIL